MKKINSLIRVSLLLLLVASCVTGRKNENSFGGPFQGPTQKNSNPETTALSTVQAESPPRIAVPSETSRAVQRKSTLVYTGQNNKTNSVATMSNDKSDQSTVPATTEKKSIRPYSIKSESKNPRSGDGWLLLVGAGITGIGIGYFRKTRKSIVNMTRWSRKNPKHAQTLIAGLQLALAGVSAYAGYNLQEMGYEISSGVGYTCAGIATLGMCLLPLTRKPDAFTLPRVFAGHKIGYFGIAVSTLMMSATFGNRIHQDHPQSIVSEAFRYTDQKVMSVFQPKMGKDAAIAKEKIGLKMAVRPMITGGAIAAAILFTILFTGTLCAGICLVLYAEGAIAMTLGGLALAALSIFGIVKAWIWAANN